VPETRTAVIVLKAKPGQKEEVLRYPHVELRSSNRQLVLFKGDAVIGTFEEDLVARWYMDDE
jgi:hypothetical protein